MVENRCYFVRVPGEGILYFDPRNPDTTACVHPRDEPGEVSPDAVPGRAAPDNCQRDQAGRLWCSPDRGALSADVVAKAYEAGVLPR